MSPQLAKRPEIWLILATLVLGALCIFSSIYVERTAVQQGTGFVPVSLSATQIAAYNVDTHAIHLPDERIEMIADAIHDQEPDADAAARFATVQANLLTPVAWIISPTPSRTPLPTTTSTPTPSLTPTPSDPWISLGYARVGCNTEVHFDTVIARRLKFQFISGGGSDNHISFYCCGSSGVAFWANNAWVPVTDRSIALNAGDSRETADVNAIVDRARFNMGCNDKEPGLYQIFYLPLYTPTPPAPAAASPGSGTQPLTPSAAVPTQAATRSPTPK